MQAPRMRGLAVLALAAAAAGCPGPAQVGPEDPTGQNELPRAPWEIVYVRSLTIDTGGCTNIETMETEAHVAPQGINVYALHYAGDDPSGAKKKLVRTVAPDEEPARGIIEAVEANGYYGYAEHPTYSLGPEPADGCTGESASITVLTPDSTGIITLVQGEGHGPPEGMALAIYQLLEGQL